MEHEDIAGLESIAPARPSRIASKRFGENATGAAVAVAVARRGRSTRACTGLEGIAPTRLSEITASAQFRVDLEGAASKKNDECAEQSEVAMLRATCMSSRLWWIHPCAAHRSPRPQSVIANVSVAPRSVPQPCHGRIANHRVVGTV